MVSKASEDLPEPDRPVNTTSWSRGMATSTFLRLCSRAPRMVIWRASRADLADRSAIRLSGTCESKVNEYGPPNGGPLGPAGRNIGRTRRFRQSKNRGLLAAMVFYTAACATRKTPSLRLGFAISNVIRLERHASGFLRLWLNLIRLLSPQCQQYRYLRGISFQAPSSKSKDLTL